MTPESNQSLSHYRLIEKIGSGGMGVVWKAQDTVLGRTVAIKVLPADVSRDENRRRMFLAEARLASSVSDAHIAQVYDFGREGDLDFIVMEHVEGGALHDMLRGRPLPPGKVAHLGHQVAQAVSRAHRKGLLHRDLKPGNILVTPEGDAKVVDFGLATLFERRDTTLASMATTETATGAGGADEKRAGVAGTLPYMSPEQARAEKLDARSDIFSLGVVLYEMTTGQRPFSGATSVALLKEIVRARPTPPHELAPKMPLDLERIIQKALAPAKADRYQTMDDLAVDLKRLGRDLESGSAPSHDELRGPSGARRRRWDWLAAGTAALALIALGARSLATRWRTTADPHSVLILPLEVRGQNDGADYLGRTFAEGIAVNLARAKALNVLPVPEMNEIARGRSLDRVRAALDMKAGRLLTGTLERNGKDIQVNVSLVDTERNRILWGSQENGGDVPLATVAEKLARSVAVEMGVTSPKLYDFFMYLAGGAAMARSPEYLTALKALRSLDLDSSLTSTKRLVDAFPNEPDAHVLRVFALHMNVSDSMGTPRLASAREAFEVAVVSLARIDPNNPWGIKFSADNLVHDGKFQEAIENYTRLLARDDLSPAARANILTTRSDGYFLLGRNDTALSDLQEAMHLNPADDFVYNFLSDVLAKEGRLDESLAAARHAIALNPDSIQNINGLGRALSRLGKYEEAIEPFRQSCVASESQWACARQALMLLLADHRSEADAIYAKAVTLPEDCWGQFTLGAYRAQAGDRAGAVRSLRRSFDLSPTDAPDWIDDPALSPLRNDTEFKKLKGDVRRMATAPGQESIHR